MGILFYFIFLLIFFSHGNVVSCLHPPVTYIWHFSSCYPFLNSPRPRLSLPWLPTNRPQCVMLLSLGPRVLIVQHPPMSKNMFGFLFLCQWKWWFPDSSKSLQRTRTYCFLWLCSIPWCICAIFSLSRLQVFAVVHRAAVNIRVHVSL